MSNQTRYAIYLLPSPASTLAKAGAEWLGWDVFKGTTLPHPDGYQIKPDEIAAITTHPRHYGFHGTLKAPFRLKSELNEADIQKAFDEFVRLQQAQDCPVLEISQLDDFYALTPKRYSNGLNPLADHAVRHFDPLRAPMTQSEYEKRDPHSMTDRQRTYLIELGYPYIFEEFRFHMTLSDRVTDSNGNIEDTLNAHFSESVLSQSQDFCIALCIEENKQPFRVLKSSSLEVALPKDLEHAS